MMKRLFVHPLAYALCATMILYGGNCDGTSVNPGQEGDSALFDVEDALSDISENTAPIATVLSPTESGVVKAGGEIQVQVEITDAEQGPDDLTVSCRFEDDEEPIVTGSPNEEDLFEASVEAPEEGGEYVLICVISDGAGGELEVNIVFTVNTRPGAPTVSISPTKPTTADTLAATIDENALDPDREASGLQTTFRWLKDGTETEYTGGVVPSSATQKGEVWTVEVYAFDGLVDGDIATASVTILNTPPAAPEIAVTPKGLTVADIATCELQSESTDVDGDELVITNFWYLNNQVITDATSETLDLMALVLEDGSLPKAGDVLACGAAASDDEVSTAPVKSEGIVLETADICGTEQNPCAADASCTNTGTIVPECICNL